MDVLKDLQVNSTDVSQMLEWMTDQCQQAEW
jgi:hypothetical protein